MSKLKYWLWLTISRRMTADKVCSVLNYFGTPENAWLAPREEFNNLDGLLAADRDCFADKSLTEAEVVLEQCLQKQISVMTIGDADYPDRLRNIPSPPPVLYIRGKMPHVDDEPAIAVVGTRKATPYGISVAGNICYELARNGVLIVSGLAAGIDSAAISAALRAGGKTIGVLGCGADVVYPAGNAKLYSEVIETGALISEFPPGTPPEGHNFPIRNRIMSGLSLGVLVVEAPKRSGALITATRALEQNRDVFAIPGPLGAVNSEGCNELIRDGAGLVTGALDILSEYAALYPHRVSIQKPENQKSRTYSANSRTYYKEPARNVAQIPGSVYTASGSANQEIESGNSKAIPPQRSETHVNPVVSNDDTSESFMSKSDNIIKKDFTDLRLAIIVTMEKGPRHVDEIIDEVGKPTSEVLAELTMLEISGDIRQLPGARFEINK